MTKFEYPNILERRNFSLLLPPLALFSLLYGVGVRLRVMAYEKTKKKTLPGFVVSIGNLTVGGTGKTPAACMLANWALGEGHRVAILSRGYGGGYQKPVLEVSDGNRIMTNAEEAGDEPFLMAKSLDGVPVVVSRKRYLAGVYAHERYESNFFILDDGFQHLSLHRDLDLVLMDASRPFGNGHLLPWGPLREPIGHLGRADAFVFTRAGGNGHGRHEVDHLTEQYRGKPIYRSEHIPEKIFFPMKKRVYEQTFLKGKRVVGFAGIARPEVLKKTLVELGAQPVSFTAFRDHHAYSRTEIRDLIEKKETTGADCIVTTEKDWVRLENVGIECPDLAFIKIRFSLLSGEERFFKMVRDAIGKKGVGEER